MHSSQYGAGTWEVLGRWKLYYSYVLWWGRRWGPVLSVTLKLRSSRALLHCGPGWDARQVGAHCSGAWKQVEWLFLNQRGSPSGTSSLPRKTPSKPLENHIFTFRKPLLQWGKPPTVTSLLQRKRSWQSCAYSCLLLPAPFSSYCLILQLHPVLTPLFCCISWSHSSFIWEGCALGTAFKFWIIHLPQPEWGASAWQPQWGLLCCFPKQLCATRHLD